MGGTTEMTTGENDHLALSPIFIDVFAGCGGLSLGLKRAGWRGLFAIEKDTFAFDTLDTNFGRHPSYDYLWPPELERRAWDIDNLIVEQRDFLRSLAGTIDLLAGGPPCQGFSHAGRRRHDDPRNRLFEDYLQLVSIIKPRIVLIENVRGFTSAFDTANDDEISNFAKTLQERLKPDYEITTAIIRASDYGIPQARPRFFLVGTRKDCSHLPDPANFFLRLKEQAELFLAERGLSKAPTAWDALSDLEVGRNGTSPASDSPGFDAIAYLRPLTAFQKAMRDGFQGAPSDTRLARHRPDIRSRFASIIAACREEGRLNTTISSELRARFNLKKMAIRVLDPLRPAPTITSLPDDLLHYSEPRTLTVRENARLQTFPDWFVFKGKYTTGGHLRRKQVPRFTQVANAVPPLLAEQLGRELIRLLRGGGGLTTEGIANDRERLSVASELTPETTQPILVD
jgi:DNA (cytosine-5)-methyltransferase 1